MNPVYSSFLPLITSPVYLQNRSKIWTEEKWCALLRAATRSVLAPTYVCWLEANFENRRVDRTSGIFSPLIKEHPELRWWKALRAVQRQVRDCGYINPISSSVLPFLKSPPSFQNLPKRSPCSTCCAFLRPSENNGHPFLCSLAWLKLQKASKWSFMWHLFFVVGKHHYLHWWKALRAVVVYMRGRRYINHVSACLNPSSYHFNGTILQISLFYRAMTCFRSCETIGAQLDVFIWTWVPKLHDKVNMWCLLSTVKKDTYMYLWRTE
jgi:hypothetical protein